MAALILEIQAQGRGQPQYRRVRQFPYRIGRAYNNDLILPDAAVSPHHLQIVCDDNGVLQIENLSQENGTRIGNAALSAPQALGDQPISLTLGRTVVRILRPDTAVAATQKHTHDSLWWQQMTRLPVALGFLLLITGINFWLDLNQSLEPDKWQLELLKQLTIAVTMVMAAAFTGFVSRMLTHRWRYGLQLTILCIAIMAIRGADEFFGVVDYFLSSSTMTRITKVATAATLFTALFAWQLRAMTHMGRERATLVAVAVIWPVLSLFQLKDVFDGDDFSPQPSMHTELRVPDLRAAETVDIPTFGQRVHASLSDAAETPPQP